MNAPSTRVDGPDLGPTLNELRQLVRSVPGNAGEQFLEVSLDLGSLNRVSVRYGMQWKRKLGTHESLTPEEALRLVRDHLIPRFNMVPWRWNDDN